jgi:hypothetical protein
VTFPIIIFLSLHPHSVMDDRWVKNQALIKTLYQDEHKTLTEVKAILERDHGFPDQS